MKTWCFNVEFATNYNLLIATIVISRLCKILSQMAAILFLFSSDTRERIFSFASLAMDTIAKIIFFMAIFFR